MIIETERLKLRPWLERDAEDLYKYASNPKIGPIAGWPPHKSLDDSLNIIKTIFSKKETYAIVFENHPIGCVGLLIHPDGNHWWGEGSCELGYWIGEEYWGRGFAVEASRPLINRAFNDLDIQRFYATYNKINNQSKRVLEKLDFKYFGEINNVNFLGEEIVEVIMNLEKEDYLKNNPIK